VTHLLGQTTSLPVDMMEMQRDKPKDK